MSTIPVAARGPAQYELVRQELERLALENEGRLSPGIVVDAARPEVSALHPYFIWDNDDAAERFRLVQAGLLIRRIRVVVVRPELPTPKRFTRVRAFASEDANRGTPKGSYAPITDVLADPGRRAALLASVSAELQALRRKYEALTELSAVWKAVDKLAT